MYYWRLISPVFAIITITLLFSINTIYGITDKLQADPSPRAGAIAAIDAEYFQTDTGLSVMPETGLSIDVRSLPEHGFCRRNEVTLIGSFLAAFIALSAVLLTKYITDRSHRKRKELNDRTLHDNILTAVKSELDQHKDILLLNRKKWNECKLEETGYEKPVFLGDYLLAYHLISYLFYEGSSLKPAGYKLEILLKYQNILAPVEH